MVFAITVCGQHTTRSLTLTGGSDGSCLHLSLPDRHFLLDEEPPPSAKLCEDRVACDPGLPNTTPQLLHWARFVIQYSIKVSQQPWSCDRWSIELHWPYC